MNSKLQPIESEILTAVAAALPAGTSGIFQRQVEEVNLVQRAAGEVNLYRVALRFFTRKFSTYFPNRLQEAPLAEVAIARPGPSRPLAATVWIVAGRVFSIEYPSAAIGTPGSRVVGVRILTDPSVKEPPEESAGDAALIDRWTNGRIRLNEIVAIKAPLEAARRTQWLERLRTKMPADWVAMIAICDGFSTGTATVQGLLGLPHAHLPEGTFLVLVEAKGRSTTLAVPFGSQDGEMLLLDHEGQIHEDLGNDFRRALTDFTSPQSPLP